MPGIVTASICERSACHLLQPSQVISLVQWGNFLESVAGTNCNQLAGVDSMMTFAGQRFLRVTDLVSASCDNL